MTFANRLKISSIMSLSLFVLLAALLGWSSGELNRARDNDILADDIQTVIFQRATLRDEYFLYSVERARLQWFALNGRIRDLLTGGLGHFDGIRGRQVLERVLADFEDSVAVSQRLFEDVRRSPEPDNDRKMAHHDEFASRLYSQIMLKDSALQQGAADLQRLTRDRFNQANQRVIASALLLLSLVLVGTMVNAFFINSLLRRRLATLNNGAAIIASGDLGYRLDCQGDDELAELGRVLNSMTERVQDYTNQLQSSHELLNDLSSQVPGILFQARRSPDGIFSTPYVSRGVHDIYEAAPGKMVHGPTTIFESFRPDEDQGFFASFQRSAMTLQPWEHEYRITVSNQRTKWLRGHARPMRLEDGGTLWHGFISDITERKLMEQALQESEKRFRRQLHELTNLYTHIPAGLFAVDQDLRFLRLNDWMAEMNGKSIEEHLGRTVDEVLPAGLSAKLKEVWLPVLERGESVLSVELQGAVLPEPDATRHWLASYQPLRSETGAVNGLMGFVLDITERKVAEQVLFGASQRLEQEVQQRTAKLSLANEHLTQEIVVRKKVEVELLAYQQKLQEMALDLSMAEERERDRIAGELHDQVGQRLILSKIKLDTLASKLPSGECETEAGEIEFLIDQTIQDIRSLTFQIRPPLLAGVGLEAALRWLGEELRADFELEVGFYDDNRDKPLRYVVRSALFQAVRELMLNVAKHAGTKRCRVRFARTGRCIEIKVEDDGVGLKTGPPDMKGSRHGGFGLSNVKQKIEYVGGCFVIEAKEGGGTRATITVPLESTGGSK